MLISPFRKPLPGEGSWGRRALARAGKGHRIQGVSGQSPSATLAATSAMLGKCGPIPRVTAMGSGHHCGSQPGHF